MCQDDDKILNEEFMMKKRLFTAIVAILLVNNVQAQLFNSMSNIKETEAPTSHINNNALNSSQLGYYFSEMKDLRGNFVQTVYSARGQQNSQGQMWLSKPGKFYWDYQSPDRQKIISNGKKVWQYDLDLEQVAVRNRSDLVGDVAMQILSGEAQLDNLFSVTKEQVNTAPLVIQQITKGAELYRLVPKQAQEGYDSVWVVMKNNELKGISVDAGRGQQTVIIFTNLKRNSGIPAKKFEFVPPKGVDVVGE